MNRKKWNFWDKVEKFVHKRKRAAWFEGGNCDSKCRNCKQSESLVMLSKLNHRTMNQLFAHAQTVDTHGEQYLHLLDLWRLSDERIIS